MQILRSTMAQDAGKAIHPSYVEGQLQGGSAQGLGWGLNEEYFYDAPEPRSWRRKALLDGAFEKRKVYA
jgi:CO/xanthine dehydrogenase Mo-binding subunit